MQNISFGWFLPTFGDTTAFGDESASVPPGNALFDDVTAAAAREFSEKVMHPHFGSRLREGLPVDRPGG